MRFTLEIQKRHHDPDPEQQCLPDSVRADVGRPVVPGGDRPFRIRRGLRMQSASQKEREQDQTEGPDPSGSLLPVRTARVIENESFG